MSTRAVYKFWERSTNESIIFYKHHDGYPNGLFGALERIRSVLILGTFSDFKVMRKLMLDIGAEELRDEMEADRADNQHRYNVNMDDGHVTMEHYDFQDAKKYYWSLTDGGWIERWKESV